MTLYYLDSSVAMLELLPPTGAPFDWVARSASAGAAIYASTLLELEVIRALRREGMPPRRAELVTNRIALISIDDSLLADAAAIEPHAKSLDAIHLATARLLGDDVVVVTHDTGMLRAAEALGLATLDPLAA